MHFWRSVSALAVLLMTGICLALAPAGKDVPEGFTSLFNGQDLSGWKIPEGDNGHWKAFCTACGGEYHPRNPLRAAFDAGA